MYQEKDTDEEVVIDAKPQTKNANQSKLSPLFSLKNVPALFAICATIFVLIGLFVAVCGGVKGFYAMIGIAVIFNLAAIGFLIADYIKNGKVYFDPIHIVVGFSIIINTIALF